MDVTASALNHLDVDVREGVSRFPIEFPHARRRAGRAIAALGEGVEAGRSVTASPSTSSRPAAAASTAAPARVALHRPGLVREHGLAGLRGARDLQGVPAHPDPGRRHRRRGGREQHRVRHGVAHADHARSCGRARPCSSTRGSGIGSAAVQVAKHAGAFVIGTSSRADKLEKAKELGLDVGIDYTSQDVVEEVLRHTDGNGVDVVYEHCGGELFQQGSTRSRRTAASSSAARTAARSCSSTSSRSSAGSCR